MSNSKNRVGFVSQAFDNFEVNSNYKGSELETTASLANNFWSMVNNIQSGSANEAFRSGFLLVQDSLDLITNNKYIGGVNAISRAIIAGDRLNINIGTYIDYTTNNDYKHYDNGKARRLG